MKHFIAIILLSLSGVGGGWAQDVALINPSFEAPVLGVGNWQYLIKDDQTNGWTFTGGGIVANATPWLVVAPDGVQAAYLQGDATVSQNITIPEAGDYTVSFLAATRPNYTADNLAVQIDGTNVAWWSSACFSSGIFIGLATNATLTAGTHNLAFVGSSPGGDTATVLDQIAISKRSSITGGPTGVLVNGSFESPALENGNWRYQNTDGLAHGWTFSGPENGGLGQGGIAAISSPWVWQVPDGRQAAFLQGETTLSQTITVTEAQKICILFAAANRPKYPADNLAVQIDGTTVAAWPSASFSNGKFVDLLAVATVSAGPHVLAFVGTSPGGDTAIAIDRVAIVKPNFIRVSDHVLQSDGSDLDTQMAIGAAADGDTILIPAGNFAWTNGVVVSGKALKIMGAGAGALFGNSTTPVAVGLGLKKFAVHASGLVPITNGMVVTAFYTAAGAAGGLCNNPPVNLTGTVTSFDGLNLTLNVTAAMGTGTQAFWTLGTVSATVITNFCPKNAAITLYEPASGNVELTGIQLIHSSTPYSPDGLGDGVHIEDGAGLALVHDCWFEVSNGNGRAIEMHSNHGLVYRCSFDNKFDSGDSRHPGKGNNDEALAFKPIGLASSWTRNSTMGADDLGGTNNFYVEDCYAAGFLTGGTDFDDNSRVVVRHCIFDNSVTSSHGLDTSPAGVRHFELYNNTFVFTDVGLATFNLNWWLFLRGGTGVIFSNIMPNIISSTWGDKGELTFTVMYPYRLGCNPNYPAPHQIGQSWSNGAAITDPVYFWDNPGLPIGNPGISQYSAGQYDSCYSVKGFPPGKPDQTNAPPISVFLQAGRDFTNAVKPGYKPYPYPHPLRPDAAVRYQMAAPTNLRTRVEK